MALKWKYSCRKNDQKSIFPYSLNIHASCIIFLMRKEKVCMFDIYFQIAVYIKACVYIYVTCTIENRLTTNKISILDPTCFGYCLHQELYLWCIFSNWYILLKGVYIYMYFAKKRIILQQVKSLFYIQRVSATVFIRALFIDFD